MHKLPPCAEYGRSLDGAHGLTDGTTSWMDSKGIEIRIKTTMATKGGDFFVISLNKAKRSSKKTERADNSVRQRGPKPQT